MFLKSSSGAIRSVRSIEDLRAIGETMKFTYKAIPMEYEDTDFQFYDRLLTRISDKILQGAEGRSVRHLHIDLLTRKINKLYTDEAKLFKSKRCLNTLIEEFYKSMQRPSTSTQLTGSTYKTIATPNQSPRRKKQSTRSAPRHARTTDHRATGKGRNA